MYDHRCARPDQGADRGEDAQDGPVLDRAADHVPRVLGLRRLRDGPGVLEQGLLRVAVPVAVLLTVPHRQMWRGRGLRYAARWLPAVGGADHPDLPAGLPDDLLLLPHG